MLNFAEREILNAHNYKISRNLAFSGSEKPRMLFFLLINVIIPIIFGSLAFMSRKNSCKAELSMNLFDLEPSHQLSPGNA